MNKNLEGSTCPKCNLGKMTAIGEKRNGNEGMVGIAIACAVYPPLINNFNKKMDLQSF